MRHNGGAQKIEVLKVNALNNADCGETNILFHSQALSM